MNKRWMSALTIVVLLVSGLVGVGCPPVEEVVEPVPVVPPPEVFEWDIQTMWPAGTLNWEIFVDWTETVEAMTDGRVLITPHPAGAIVPTFDCLLAVQAGVLEGQNQWPGYYAGIDPAFAALAGLQFSFPELWQHYAWFYHLGGLEYLRELYAEFDIYVIGLTWWGMESFPSKDELRRLEDIEGLMMRSPGGMAADIWSRFGAGLIVLPGEEIYPALERGVIDLTDWGTPSMNYMLGLHEVATYFSHPGFHHAPVNEIAVHMDEWNKLPADLQAILHTSVRDKAWDHIVRIALADAEAIETMIALGNVPIAWEPEEIARLAAIAVEVWDEWAAKSPLSFRAIESQKDFMRRLGLLE